MPIVLHIGHPCVLTCLGHVSLWQTFKVHLWTFKGPREGNQLTLDVNGRTRQGMRCIERRARLGQCTSLMVMLRVVGLQCQCSTMFNQPIWPLLTKRKEKRCTLNSTIGVVTPLPSPLFFSKNGHMARRDWLFGGGGGFILGECHFFSSGGEEAAFSILQE